MKKKIQQLQEKRLARKGESTVTKIPRITNENVAEHREEILSGARKYIYPLQHSKHRIVILTTSLAILTILIFTTVSVALLYRQQTTSGFMYQVTKVLPFPVARSGNTLIAYENYLFELRHYIHYYETQQQLSFDTESGQAQLNSYKKRALDSVVDLAYIKEIAKELGVTVSDAEIDVQIQIAREQNRLGSSDEIFEDVLRNYWNWSVADFRRSLESEILKQKVTRALDTETETRAKEALAKLEAGEDFAAVAEEYSDDEFTKNNGGVFGVVDATDRNVSHQTVDTLFKLGEGQYSGINVIPYQTGYALEIVQNLGEKSGGREGAHIVFQLKDIAEILNDRKDEKPYRLYISLSE
jgi:hypothetical protein